MPLEEVRSTLEILPREELERFLNEFPCLVCDRKLQNHTPLERQTCHDALTSVTLLRQTGEHNPLPATEEEKKATCRRFNPAQTAKEGENC